MSSRSLSVVWPLIRAVFFIVHHHSVNTQRTSKPNFFYGHKERAYRSEFTEMRKCLFRLHTNSTCCKYAQGEIIVIGISKGIGDFFLLRTPSQRGHPLSLQDPKSFSYLSFTCSDPNLFFMQPILPYVSSFVDDRYW